MKIAVLHGQNHKGNTFYITSRLLGSLNVNPEEIKEFYTNDLPSCTGCLTCILKDEELCPHRALVGPIIEAIEQADVIIAESPNYCMDMSGQLKTFFDHMAYRWMSHRPHPAMRHKIGVAISTTAGSGAKRTAKSIERQMFWWHIGKTYRITAIVGGEKLWKEESKVREKINLKIEDTVKRIRRKLGRVRPGGRSKIIFEMMRGMQKGKAYNPADQKYWQDNEWI